MDTYLSYAGAISPDPSEQLVQSNFLILKKLLMQYMTEVDIQLIERSFLFALRSHRGQYRKSGEPFIIHPITVALILSKWNLDVHTVTAAILHDVVEDTKVTINEISHEFGQSVAHLVESVSKVCPGFLIRSAEDLRLASFRKVIVATVFDMRVVLIKLADRLHNMLTLSSLSIKKREVIAQETLDKYAPLAKSLGLSELYVQLDCLASFHLESISNRVLLNHSTTKILPFILLSYSKVSASIQSKSQAFGSFFHIHNKVFHMSFILPPLEGAIFGVMFASWYWVLQLFSYFHKSDIWSALINKEHIYIAPNLSGTIIGVVCFFGYFAPIFRIPRYDLSNFASSKSCWKLKLQVWQNRKISTLYHYIFVLRNQISKRLLLLYYSGSINFRIKYIQLMHYIFRWVSSDFRYLGFISKLALYRYMLSACKRTFLEYYSSFICQHLKNQIMKEISYLGIPL